MQTQILLKMYTVQENVYFLNVCVFVCVRERERMCVTACFKQLIGFISNMMFLENSVAFGCSC